MTLQGRLRNLIDRLLSALLATIVVGTTLAFGGAVWWARPLVATLVVLMVAGWFLRLWLDGSWRMLRSPLVPLGLLSLLLALAQLAPLPGPLARVVSSRAWAMHALGVLPDRVDDPSIELPEPMVARSPATVDRSATLRWLAGAAACLALFWATGQYTHRLGHLYVVWGSVVAAFLLNTVFGVAQFMGDSGSLYGVIEPGSGGPYTPSRDDLLNSPNTTLLRLESQPAEPGTAAGSWALARPARSFLVGSLMGGPGAYLALGALGLPLALGLVLQLMAPRGSREGLKIRLAASGITGLVVLLSVLIAASAALIGLLAGPILCLPFVAGVLVVGLPGAWASGLRWTAVAMSGIVITLLLVGVVAGSLWASVPAEPTPLAERTMLATARHVWLGALRIVRDFPLMGAGAGTFATFYPHYKSLDRASTTAMSSLLQWLAETGTAGLTILGIAFCWCVWRLPRAVGRVGTADRVLAFGLVGTLVCFGCFSALHWTVELGAVAIAAAAVGGLCDRWLAGGTDLFVC